MGLIVNIIILMIFVLLGYVVAALSSGRRAGKQGRIKSLIFDFGNIRIHIHHWLWASTILIILVLIELYNDIVYGFFIGLVVQGLTYSDFYRIVYKKK